MFVSFVVYFHSSRLDNLRQTLRFLAERDGVLVTRSELVLVCHDDCPPVPSSFCKMVQVGLGLSDYNKPLLNNHGVKLATGEALVLLDSDRILSAGYFGRVTSMLRPGLVITTRNLLQLLAPVSDNEIRQGFYAFRPDPRSDANAMHRKNALSGNTVMLRADYLAAGGMDESFEGYGYADNDFTRTLAVRGAEFVFLDDLELHLYHDRHWDSFRSQNLANGIRYCRKWGLRPAGALGQLAVELGVDIDAALGRRAVKMV